MKSAYQYVTEKMQMIKPKMSYSGESFLEWQQASREKLSELLGLDKFEKCNLEPEIEYRKKLKMEQK